MTGPVHIEHEIVQPTVDASGTVVASVDAAADPLGLNPILSDLGLAVDYFRLIRVLNRRDLTVSIDWHVAGITSHRRDAATAQDIVAAGVSFSQRDAVASVEMFALAFVQRSRAASVDWIQQHVRTVRIDRSVAVDVLALAVSRSRRDTATSHDFGDVVLENYAVDYADDYVGDATSF